MSTDFGTTGRSDLGAFRRSDLGVRGHDDGLLPYFMYRGSGGFQIKEQSTLDYWPAEGKRGLSGPTAWLDWWPGRGVFGRSSGNLVHTDYFGDQPWSHTPSSGETPQPGGLAGLTSAPYLIWHEQVPAESIIARINALTGGSEATKALTFEGNTFYGEDLQGDFSNSGNAWCLARIDTSTIGDPTPTLGHWYLLQLTVSPLAITKAKQIALSTDSPAPQNVIVSGEGGTVYIGFDDGTALEAYLPGELERDASLDFATNATFDDLSPNREHVVHGEFLFARTSPGGDFVLRKYDRTGAVVDSESTLSLSEPQYAVAQKIPLPIAIESVSPADVRDDGTTTVTLTGSGFAAGMKVYIDGSTTVVTDVTVVSSTQATFVAPSHATGLVDLWVQTGSDYDQNLDAFTYITGTRPTIEITDPAGGFKVGTTAVPVTFAGTANDAEDGDISSSIAWTSSIDGSLGSGASISVSLSAGLHAITATITDSDGNSANAGAAALIS